MEGSGLAGVASWADKLAAMIFPKLEKNDNDKNKIEEENYTTLCARKEI